mmetsp:Transcript_24920/g.52149  ORF Transcript_24920/g.52149 Transcript_24920/m.52149 type:complete len:209 (+) Transcript_24920:365-991(+)
MRSKAAPESNGSCCSSIDDKKASHERMTRNRRRKYSVMELRAHQRARRPTEGRREAGTRVVQLRACPSWNSIRKEDSDVFEHVARVGHLDTLLYPAKDDKRAERQPEEANNVLVHQEELAGHVMCVLEATRRDTALAAVPLELALLRAAVGRQRHNLHTHADQVLAAGVVNHRLVVRQGQVCPKGDFTRRHMLIAGDLRREQSVALVV